MRIENSAWAGTAMAAQGSRRGGPAFALRLAPDSPAPARTPSASPSVALYDVQSLIALQAFEDPRERRKRAMKRGFDLLDVLEGVKMDMLVGTIAPDRLERLVGMLGNKQPSGDPRLDELVEDIELRARVELAKLGRYPD